MLVKPFQKALWACKIVWGTFFAAGQSPARNCMHSAKPRSKNHCVQSPHSLRAVNSSADPPSAEFPNSLPQKKELNWNSPIACQKTQNRLPKSGSGVSGFRGSKTLQILKVCHGFSKIRTPKSTHPRSRFWQSILCFLASYWGIPILVSVIPASYWGNSSVQGRFCRQAIRDIPFRRSCCCDKLLFAACFLQAPRGLLSS